MKRDPYASSVFTDQYELPTASYPEMPEPLPEPKDGTDDETLVNNYGQVMRVRGGRESLPAPIRDMLRRNWR